MRPVLPVSLPAGYDFAREYDYGTFDDDPDPMSLDDETTTKRASSWSVHFLPKEGAYEDGLPVIVLCVQDPTSRGELCSTRSDATHLQRQFGQTQVVIYRASDGSPDMTAWSTLELTTDLDKVTWLH
ncbi:hypothetical protein [Actinopolymorpha alba]|uniref:hypothetical protein n=1 Tax=Actinopolymorpha alba TaxID=533267 RepID=UPI00039FED21|nr:hypothetical protein [Actinopolymorpha alba]